VLSILRFSATDLYDEAILGPGAATSNVESVFKEYCLVLGLGL
jgi:hypothetical protein